MDIANAKFFAHVQFVAKIKGTKCRYYTLEYYPSEIKRKSKYLLKKSKCLPEEIIGYPPLHRGYSCRMIYTMIA
ncbi:MAG: hypothetical protein IJT36_10050 [Alphaproteobacteria bacterium]|nr:hypothetical protein [Alphaproteobacteria bacterium]